VEQLKVYNSRRRLRGAVMAAVSSPRWTYQSSLDSNSNAIEQFSDFGDDDISNSGKYILTDNYLNNCVVSITILLSTIYFKLDIKLLALF
jgi:hypothetical protein